MKQEELERLAKQLVQIVKEKGAATFLSYAPGTPTLVRRDSYKLLDIMTKLLPNTETERYEAMAVFMPNYGGHKDQDVVERMIIGLAPEQIWLAWQDNYQCYNRDRFEGLIYDLDEDFKRVNTNLRNALKEAYKYDCPEYSQIKHTKQ